MTDARLLKLVELADVDALRELLQTLRRTGESRGLGLAIQRGLRADVAPGDLKRFQVQVARSARSFDELIAAEGRLPLERIVPLGRSLLELLCAGWPAAGRDRLVVGVDIDAVFSTAPVTGEVTPVEPLSFACEVLWAMGIKGPHHDRKRFYELARPGLERLEQAELQGFWERVQARDFASLEALRAALEAPWLENDGARIAMRRYQLLLEEVSVEPGRLEPFEDPDLEERLMMPCLSMMPPMSPPDGEPEWAEVERPGLLRRLWRKLKGGG